MSTQPARAQANKPNRWIQLILGIVCMASVANLQYGWTLFVLPIQHHFGWTKAEIQIAFTIFILFETWLVPFEGAIVDRIGPRWMIAAGGVCTFIAWGIDSMATSLWMLYLGGAIAGFAGGAVYGTCVGNALKWFPDKRGLCAGLTAAGFGAGAAITIAPIRAMISSSGYQHTFLVFAIIYGVIIVVVSNFIRAPRDSDIPPVTIKVAQSTRDLPPSQAVRSPIFWIMYLMFFLVAAGGLMSAAQLAPIAKERGIADALVTIFGITTPAIVAALTAHSITNGVGRPLNGWISDHIGRANMMGIAFGIEALCIAAFGFFGTTPISFIITDALVFLFWGDIFSLFAATVGDAFGRRYVTVNYGIMYTAKGVASLLVPLGNVLTHMTGSWHAVYAVGCGMNVVAALLGFFVLRPVIKSRLSSGSSPETEAQRVGLAT
ncbi:MAG TPA: oxalate/formate MFS antiporter [Pseudolabrys sp.]|jgi:OFA family oxalate/formate antiporter-like MFS transporter|uniref:oxalate/formate MFS antiporter n=1 Tax=Pseudolabrys sp. TaxID=1960880 RepID=UPI002DDDB20D|nr:oxalate/formate MFS antiporter [Pseudolabrys sp.]HEV2629172.1 oxalate/formate MFS antiporter [Pseudolabrys sp.]